MSKAAGVPTVRISEIFHSLQGESSRVGLPTVFIRLTGCPLRCRWCDTNTPLPAGEPPIDEIVAEAGRHGTRTVCVTGGEPLAQKNCLPLLTALCDAGFDVSLETSGALDIGDVDPRVSRIMDLKAPGSGESTRTCRPASFLDHGPRRGQDRHRRPIRLRMGSRHHRGTPDCGRCQVLLSPVQGELAPADLAGWILEDRLPVRFQLQLHKVLWGNMQRQVVQASGNVVSTGDSRMNTNRRQFSRIAFHTHAELTTGHGQFDVVVLDLSLKGGLIRMPLGHKIVKGENCTLRVPLGDLDATIRMQGTVAHGGALPRPVRRNLDIDSATHLRRLV